MALPRVNVPFTLPVEEAFGRFVGRYFAQIIPDTPGMVEFVSRPFAQAAAFVPGRMVDAAEDMLLAYRGNDTGAPRALPLLPVILAAVARDYTPIMEDMGRIAADPVYCQIPGDPKSRLFRLRSASVEIRVQLAFIAQEKHTARSLAMQFQLFCSAIPNRTFMASYPLAGMDEQWPVQLERPEIMAQAVPLEVKNLVILTADLNLRAAIPMLSTTQAGDPDTDGLGTDPVTDPSGWLPAHVVAGQSRLGATTATPTPWPTIP